LGRYGKFAFSEIRVIVPINGFDGVQSGVLPRLVKVCAWRW